MAGCDTFLATPRCSKRPGLAGDLCGMDGLGELDPGGHDDASCGPLDLAVIGGFMGPVPGPHLPPWPGLELVVELGRVGFDGKDVMDVS